MNTLHRFTESLVAVNDFRKMWAHEAHGQRGKLLEGMGDAESPSQVRAGFCISFARVTLTSIFSRTAATVPTCRSGEQVLLHGGPAAVGAGVQGGHCVLHEGHRNWRSECGRGGDAAVPGI